MSRYKVALDGMGGDYAPDEIIKGAIEAVNECPDVDVIFLGTSDAGKALMANDFDRERITFVETTEVVIMDEKPTEAVKKKDSSLVKGLSMLKTKEAEAFVSAGNTGAVLVAAQLYGGKIPGVRRCPLAPLIPTMRGQSLLVDCGANVDCRAVDLVSFARLGTIYMENVMGIKNPKVGIVNNGAEENKGNALVKEAFPLLKECGDINFIGSVESRDIPQGEADIVVCDAFVGNVVLKMYEGVAGTLMDMIKETLMSSLKTKIGGALIKTALKEKLKALSTDAHGGAPMLGLSGLVVKTHGNSKAPMIKNSILQCVEYARADISGKITEAFSKK